MIDIKKPRLSAEQVKKARQRKPSWLDTYVEANFRDQRRLSEKFHEMAESYQHRQNEIALQTKRMLTEAFREALNGTGFAEDAALGKKRRKQLQEFAGTRTEDIKAEREAEWAKWRKEAERLKAKCRRLPSKRELAAMVKKNLTLTDSIETIRKRM